MSSDENEHWNPTIDIKSSNEFQYFSNSAWNHAGTLNWSKVITNENAHVWGPLFFCV